MSKKISAEIRQQVLQLLKRGARSSTIATQLRVSRSWAKQCQYRFDRGDLTWLDPTYCSSVTPELALRAVREYEICRNYSQVARVCNISPADVYHYVQNMYGKVGSTVVTLWSAICVDEACHEINFPL